MLQLLHIENIAVIEEADITFDEGFNALTGETGAGKSIVIDAMGAVLGGRTSRELIRTGADKAFVSASFSGVAPELPGLAENGVAPEEDGTLLRVDCGDPEGTPGEGTEISLWFDAAAHVLVRGEISVDGSCAVRCEVESFTAGG